MKYTPPKTEGERLLREVPGTLAAIAAAVSVKSSASVLGWKRGDKVPNPSTRETFAKVYKIPQDAWDLPPGGKTVTAAVPMPSVPAVVPTTLAETLALLAEVRQSKLGDDLTPATRAKLTAEERALLKLRSNLEMQESVIEDKLGHCSAWLELRAGIVGAIKDCDHCAHAVEAFIAAKAV